MGCVLDVRWAGTQVQYSTSTGQPAAAAAAAEATTTAAGCSCGSGRAGDLPPLGLKAKKKFWNGFGHNRSNVSGTWAEHESVHSNFPRSMFSLMPSKYESGWLGRFEMWEFLSPPENK